MSLLSLNNETLQAALSFTSPAAVFLLAAGATLHCSLMCGPLVASVQSLQKSRGGTAKASFFQHQLGRSLSYTAAGFAAAAVGHAIRPNPILVIAFLVLVTVMVIAQLFQISLPISGFQRFSAKLMQPLHFAMKRLGRFQSFGVGLLTPLIPCGQLWMVLGFAALAPSQLEGAAIALAFSILSAPGVYGFRYVKDLIMSLGSSSPALIRLGLRSMIVFVLALSAFRFSTLMISQSMAHSPDSTNSQQSQKNSPLLCH